MVQGHVDDFNGKVALVAGGQGAIGAGRRTDRRGSRPGTLALDVRGVI